MNKGLIKLTVLVSALILLTNCKKFGSTFDAYFYTDVEGSAGPLFLFVDGESKGELPNLKTSTSPANDTVLNKALHLKLRSGKYKIEGKDSDGKVKFSGYLKFRSNCVANGGTLGGQATASSGKVIVTKIYY